MIIEEFKSILEQYNQGHILKIYERLSDDKKEKLVNQVLRINFDEIFKLYNQANTKPEFKNNEISPMPYVDSDKLTDEEKETYIKVGEEIIKSNKFAVVMVAGGQGTRLGHNGPKGTFDIGLSSHKSLFEIFCDKLKNARDEYSVSIPWYIMTSYENDNDTRKFFEEHDYFGYKDGIKKTFIQGELPMIDTDGKIIIDENGKIKEAADGHGGIFRAMVDNGIVDELKNNGIEWIFTCAVDNPLVQMIDPLLIGFSALNNFMATSKSIVKSSPEEKVGVFCMKDGRPAVIEYIEISDDMANMRDEQGEFVYGEAHIMLNLFNINIIDDIAREKLPYHTAVKKCNYMNENGEIIEAQSPNAYKFEAFIFDAFRRLDKMGILRGKREENFAPVKNATGNDSPETARELYVRRYER